VVDGDDYYSILQERLWSVCGWQGLVLPMYGGLAVPMFADSHCAVLNAGCTLVVSLLQVRETDGGAVARERGE
jgi:hypothetical protein